MNKHSKNNLESVACPFAVEIKSIEWNDVKSVVSLDDRADTVIVQMKNDEKFLVSIPKVLYDAIFKSGEDNVIEQDVGFNDIT